MTPAAGTGSIHWGVVVLVLGLVAFIVASPLLLRSGLKPGRAMLCSRPSLKEVDA